jgi:hypothetical protein
MVCRLLPVVPSPYRAVRLRAQQQLQEQLICTHRALAMGSMAFTLPTNS